MKWTIPGTHLTIERENADKVDEIFKQMFLTEGLLYSQIVSIADIEQYAIGNWVKRGYLRMPIKRRYYDMDQVCRIVTINMLKGVLTLDNIVSLLQYINGDMLDTSDDIISDSMLYFLFVRIAARVNDIGGEDWDDAIACVMEGYKEPFAGAHLRVTNVLRVMLNAWFASQLKARADQMIEGFGAVNGIERK